MSDTNWSEVRADWTPEPWFVGQTEIDPDEWEPDGIMYTPPSEADKDEELKGGYYAEPYEIGHCSNPQDAVRIVACVNACAGIPTAQLLATSTVSEAKAKIAELVAAAEEAAQYMLGELRNGNPTGMGKRLRAAIAAMKELQGG